MIIEKIEIENFLLIERASIVLSSGVYWLEGQNHDEYDTVSNGSGKTTLLRAIAWCLFGDILVKGLKADGVIGPNGSYCRVILHLNKDGRKVIIDRGRKYPGRRSADAIVYVDGLEDVNDQSRHKNNKEYIERLLGISSSIFYFAAYAEASAPTFCDLSATEMLSVCAKSLNLDKYDLFNVELKKNIKELEVSKKLKNIETSSTLSVAKETQSFLEMLDEELENFTKNKEDYIAKTKASLEQTKQKLEEYKHLEGYIETTIDVIKSMNQYEAVLQTAQASVNILTKDFDAKKDTLNKIKTKLNLAEADYKNARAEYENLAMNATNQCSYCNSHFNPRELKDKIDSFMAKMNEAALLKSDLQAKSVTMAQELEGAKIKLSEAVDALTDAQKNYEILNRAKENLRVLQSKNANRLTIQNTLYVMADDLDKKMKETPDGINAKIANLENRLAACESKYNQQLAELKALDLEIEAAQKLVKINTAIKRATLDNFIIDLQGSINAYLEKIAGGITCVLNQEDEKIEIGFTAASKNGEVLPYAFFSSGERVKIAKSVSLALNDLFNIGLMIDDEGVSYLDVAGTRAVFDFMANHRPDSTRIFVTHSTLIQQDYQANKILVTKKNGKSTVEVLNG